VSHTPNRGTMRRIDEYAISNVLRHSVITVVLYFQTISHGMAGQKMRDI
jgi:hypothetical protein